MLFKYDKGLISYARTTSIVLKIIIVLNIASLIIYWQGLRTQSNQINEIQKTLIEIQNERLN